MEQNISVFGHMSSGETVYSVKLRNHFLSCEVITYGATLRTLLVPDRDGKSTDIVLGYDTLEGYISGAIEKSMNVVNLDSLARAIEDLANRPIRLNVNGREVALATAGDFDSVNGLRTTFTGRGLVLE